jgi:hypothetical protein
LKVDKRVGVIGAKNEYGDHESIVVSIGQNGSFSGHVPLKEAQFLSRLTQNKHAREKTRQEQVSAPYTDLEEGSLYRQQIESLQWCERELHDTVNDQTNILNGASPK